MNRKGPRNHLNLMLPAKLGNGGAASASSSTGNSPSSTASQPLSSTNTVSPDFSTPSANHESAEPGGPTILGPPPVGRHAPSQPPSEGVDVVLRPAGPPSVSVGNRSSTVPVDVHEVQRQLQAQEIDENQRQRLIEFVSQKQKIIELSVEDFERLTELGKGNGGVVCKVRHKPTNLIMAKKTIHLEIKPAVCTQIIRELQVLHDCNSPYIVGYYCAFIVDGDISICMEYMDGGSLDLVLRQAGRMPEPIVGKITWSVLKGLVYLREALHMIHRDVKPSNILVNMDGEVKLCDFGVSGHLINSIAITFVGTRSYMAPERLTGEQYNILSDVWSLGLSLMELAIGCYPIPASEPDDFLEAFDPDRAKNLAQHATAAREGTTLPPMKKGRVSAMAIFELLSYIVDQSPPTFPKFGFSEDFLDFLDSCLKKEPHDRAGLESLIQYPFVSPDRDPDVNVGAYIRAIMAAYVPASE